MRNLSLLEYSSGTIHLSVPSVDATLCARGRVESLGVWCVCLDVHVHSVRELLGAPVASWGLKPMGTLAFCLSVPAIQLWAMGLNALTAALRFCI